MTRHPDHPLLRREISCPVCNAYKGGGKVMCSDCHIEFEAGSDLEREELEMQFDAAERSLEMQEALGIW